MGVQSETSENEVKDGEVVEEEEEVAEEDEAPEEPAGPTLAEQLEEFGVSEELRAEVSALEVRLAEATAEAAASTELVASLKDAQLRLSADFENFRKRMTREKEQLSSSAKSSILESLLPVVDNFELAKGSIKCETEGEEKINQSYQNMYKQMVETFRGLGLTAVPAVGEPFDPEVHEALMREPTADAEEGTIIKEFRRGFTYNGSLLRPAMVGVAAPPEEVDADADGSVDLST